MSTIFTERSAQPAMPHGIRTQHHRRHPLNQWRIETRMSLQYEEFHLVDKVRVGDLVHALVQVGARLEAGQPGLALLNLLLAERQLDGLVIRRPCKAFTNMQSCPTS